MNPFAHFAFGSTVKPPDNDAGEPSSGAELSTTVETESLSPLQKKRTVERIQSCSTSIANSTTKRKKKNASNCGTSNKSDPEIMATFWVELRSLTSNYPFAVLLTGVLGSQTRDVVTVGVMKHLAASLDNDICPLNICAKTFDELELLIKRLNYCHKKTRSMMDLAVLFRSEAVPSTLHGLKTVPGVGPVISEIVLRVAFGANYGATHSDNRESDAMVAVEVCGVNTNDQREKEI